MGLACRPRVKQVKRKTTNHTNPESILELFLTNRAFQPTPLFSQYEELRSIVGIPPEHRTQRGSAAQRLMIEVVRKPPGFRNRQCPCVSRKVSPRICLKWQYGLDATFRTQRIHTLQMCVTRRLNFGLRPERTATFGPCDAFLPGAFQC